MYMEIVSVESHAGKWQLRSQVVLGKEALKLCFYLTILMHDPMSLVLGSNYISICNMFAILDTCDSIIPSVVSDL